MPKNGPQSIEAEDFTTLARIADIFLIYRDRATKSAPDFEIPLTFSGYVKAMTDGVGNINSSIAPVAKRPSVYQSESIREIRARAESIRQHTSPEEQDGLTLLNRILGQNQPLSANVPRRFYLNINI